MLEELIKQSDPAFAEVFRCTTKIFKTYPTLEFIDLTWAHVRYRAQLKNKNNRSHWDVNCWPVDVPNSSLQKIVDSLPLEHIASFVDNTKGKYPFCMKGIELSFGRMDSRIRRWVKQ